MTFYELDQLIYNTLKVPFYQLDIIGIQRVRTVNYLFSHIMDCISIIYKGPAWSIGATNVRLPLAHHGSHQLLL